jgi:hypothetical protein
VDGAHVYWSNYVAGTIGRANRNGTGVDQSFISGASVPQGVAVDPPSNRFRFARLILHEAIGTATLVVRVPHPGQLALFGRKVKRATKTVAGDSAQRVKLPIRPKLGARRALNRYGTVRVRVRVTYTPTLGFPRTRSKLVTLRKSG